MAVAQSPLVTASHLAVASLNLIIQILKMKILEQSIIAKSPNKKSEDGIVVTPDFIAVIDGSTSKTKRRHCPIMSNGRYAMLLISHVRCAAITGSAFL